MLKPLALALSFAAALAASAADPAAPAPIAFYDDTYVFVGRQVDASRVAEDYLRAGETVARFTRRLTVADLLTATNAKATALGVMKIATLRTPGLEPETFVDEAAAEHDISVVWYDLTDDGAAVQYHAARFVDLPAGGVREYHYTLRSYTNGGEPDLVLASLHSEQVTRTLDDVSQLSKLDRAPQHPPADKKTAKKN